MKKKAPEKASLLQDLKEIREKIAAIEAAEARRENAAKVLDRARAETEARVEKQARAVKRAEERLQEAEDRNKRIGHQVRLLSSAVEQSTEGVSLCDLGGHLVYVNPAFAELHGYTPDELIGKPLHTCHTREQMAEVEEANKTLHETGTFAGEILHLRRDKTVFAALLRSSILKDETGKEIGVISTIRDLSGLREAEAALSEQNAEHARESESLETAKQELKAKIAEQTAELAAVKEYLKAKIEKHSEVVTALQSANSELEKRVETQATELLQAREALQKATTELESARAASDEFKAALEKELEEKSGALVEAQAELEAMKAEENKAAEELLTAKTKLEEQLTQHAADFEAAKRELDEAKQTAAALEKSRSESEARVESRDSELQKAQDALRTATEDLEATRAASEEATAALQKQLDDKSAALVEAQSALKTKRTEDEQAVEELLTAQIKLEEQVSQQAANLETANAELEKVTSEHKRIDDALKSSEMRYKSVLLHMTDGVVLADAETGDLVQFNDQAFRNLGYTAEEFKTFKAPDYEIMKSKEKMEKHLKQNGRPGFYILETNIKAKDGDIRTMLVTSQAIQLLGRKMLLSTWHDVTMERQIRQALENARNDLTKQVEEHQAELDKAKESMVALEKARSESETSAERRTVELRKAQEALQTLTEQLNATRTASEEATVALQKKLEEKTAALVEAQSALETKRAEDDQAVEELLNTQIKLEEQLAQQAAELDKAKGELERKAATQEAQAEALPVSVIDEMDTSMQTVQGILDTLKSSHRQQNYLMPGMDLGALFRFERACSSLNKTVKTLQEMASSPEDEEKPEPLNVNSIIGNTISPMIGRLKADNIKVNLNLASNLPKTAGLSDRLQEVIQKLMDRAVHAIKSGPESPFAEITIGTGIENDRIVIRVTDNGPALSDAEMEAMFEVASCEGDAMDVSRCRAMLEEHGGEIGVKRGPDGDTVFTVVLPVG